MRYANERIADASCAAQKPYWQERVQHLYDRIRCHRTTATFLQPKSVAGVMLLLGSMDTDADSMTNTTDQHERAELERRLRRVLYCVVRYMEARGSHRSLVAGGIYLQERVDNHALVVS